jgi:hypothetical protein
MAASSRTRGAGRSDAFLVRGRQTVTPSCFDGPNTTPALTTRMRVAHRGRPERPHSQRIGARPTCISRRTRQATRDKFYFYYELPFIAPLLTDPRWKEALSRYGFVAYWREKGWPAYCRPLGDDDFECGPAVGYD